MPQRCMIARCLVCLVSLASTLELAGCKSDYSDADITEMSLGDIRKNVDAHKKNQILLLDARSPQEFAREHLPDSRNLSLDRVSGRKGDIDPDLERFTCLVVYGDDPGSAVAKGVTKRLMMSGYKGVYFFRGGLQEWQRAGLPVVTPLSQSDSPPPKPSPATGGKSGG